VSGGVISASPSIGVTITNLSTSCASNAECQP
jgi:hypothetical protein